MPLMRITQMWRDDKRMEEYKNISKIPQNRFPFPATIASKAINTGVEHGDEKTPPNIPATNAPIVPLALLFDNKFMDGMT